MKKHSGLLHSIQGSALGLARLAVLVTIGVFVAGGTNALRGVLPPPTNLHIANYLYIATNGLDSNPGTQEQPLATLEAAQAMIRGLKQAGQLGTNSYTVWIRNGTYYRSSTFTLDARDCGARQAPIIYRAVPKETVVFTGAKAITNFAAVTNAAILSRLPASARNSVLMADISGLGISDYGSLTNRGASRQERTDLRSGPTRPWMVELFFDDQRQPLARWPNQDKSEEVWTYTAAPVPGTWHEGPTDNWFTYRENNPSTWALTEEVWVHGMWTYWWADSYEKLVSVDPAARKITTDRPGDYGFSANMPFEALNVLEELDQPGEWVIDQVNRRIYFWPPSTDANQRTSLSILDSDFVRVTNACDIQFQNLIFENGRASGMSMRRSTNIVVAGCTFRNLGNMGVVVGNSIYTNSASALPVAHDYEGGQSNRVEGCHLHDLGEGGIIFSGGNRVTLQPSGHLALNNYIHHFNTNIRCYRPAVKLDGVGATVSHAVIHDSAHDAITFEGNDHLIEYCNIFRVCKDTSDAGVIYSCAADWRQRGTTIRYNLIQPCREHGIYLDDFTSGVSVYGNILMEVLYPILIGGGRDNTAVNNLVIGYSSVGWHVNNRGTTWASGSITGLVTSLKTVDYTHAPYSKYPGMLALQTDISNYSADSSATNLYELGMAKGNGVLTNVFLAAKAYTYDIDTNRIAQAANSYYPYFTDFSGFTVSPTVDAVRTRNFALKPDSAPILAGFQQIPQSQIGIYDDAYGLVTRSMIPAYPPVLPRAPFKGQPLSIPGTIQIEDFDEGPPGEAYYNPSLLDYGNNAWGSGRYRLEAPVYIWGDLLNNRRNYTVDIYYAPAWLEYTVNIAQAGTYNLAFAYTSMNGTFHLNLDGAQITPGMTATNATAKANLPQGTHVLRLVCEGTGGSRLDYINFQKAP